MDESCFFHFKSDIELYIDFIYGDNMWPLNLSRVIVEKVNLDPEAPQVHQDLLGLAPVTAQ